METARTSKHSHTPAAKCYANHLADLKRRAPFERMLIEQGYSFVPPIIFYKCPQDNNRYDKQDLQPFYLYTTKNVVRLNMPTYGLISDIDPATVKWCIKLANKAAAVTRFIDSGDGYIQAEAVFHGKFNRKKFSKFLEHWRADIEPKPLVKDLALKQWHLIRMGR